MFYVRTTKTASKAVAVQIVRYKNRRMIIVKHIGSAHDENEKEKLKSTAHSWIKEATQEPTLFPNVKEVTIAELKQYKYMGYRYGFAYENLYKLCEIFKYHLLGKKLLLDLVITRIIEPSSKLQSIEFLKEYLGIEHRREYIYRQIPEFLKEKNLIESKTISIARKEFNIEITLVFYDVTTLYFESSETDELRQCGYSKDNKFNQPQIVLGLLVSAEGFPLGYQIFEGKKFEGHTLIPVILKFKKKHKIEKFTVVADAAMISIENIAALRAANLHYIVGARVANLPLKNIEAINSKLSNRDCTTIRNQTEYGDLICEFSAKRYAKDKREMDKYILRAEKLIKNPGGIKRAKFITSQQKSYALNESLINKTKLLLGIKGYYTNLPENEVSNNAVIEHYHNLWHVEQSFRITKSDLQIRPIYHYKRQMIEAHVLICFMALALCKFIELKTDYSIKAFLKLLKGVTDARLLNTISKEEIILRSEINDQIKNLLIKMGITA